MRVMIVSDTHGKHQALDEALEKAGKIDMLLHLGDVEGGEHYIEAVAGCPVCMVAGNNDFFSFLEKERNHIGREENLHDTWTLLLRVPWNGDASKRRTGKGRGYCDVRTYAQTISGTG